MSDHICREHGKSICVKTNELGIYSTKKYKAIEKGMTSDYKSFVHDCYKAVNEVKGQAINREDFIAKMNDKGYETEWLDTRKHITFTDIERENHGEKKCKVRNSNLEKTYKESFGKEDLEHGFERNYESKRTEQRAREQLEEVNRGTSTDNTEPNINDFKVTIGNADNANNTERARREAQRADEIRRREQEQRAKEQKAIKRSQRSQGYER